MSYIKSGYGFHVGQNFARAPKNLPIHITTEYAKPRHVIGYIDSWPDSKLEFMRIGDKNGKIRVHIPVDAISE